MDDIKVLKSDMESKSMEVKTLFSFSNGAEIMLESGIISDNEDTIVFIKSKNNHTFINFGYVDYCYVYNKHHFSGHNLENLEAGLYELESNHQVQEIQRYLLISDCFIIDIVTDFSPQIDTSPTAYDIEHTKYLSSDKIVSDNWEKLSIPKDNYLSGLRMNNKGELLILLIGNNYSLGIEIRDFVRIQFCEEGRDIYDAFVDMDQLMKSNENLYVYRTADKKIYTIEWMLNYNFRVEYL